MSVVAMSSPNDPEQALDRIVKLVDHAFLERDDSVVRDVNVFGAYPRAALRDVAETDPVLVLERLEAVGGIERVHFKRSRVDEKSRTDELAVLVVVAQHVADVLAQKTLDALAKLL